MGSDAGSPAILRLIVSSWWAAELLGLLLGGRIIGEKLPFAKAQRGWTPWMPERLPPAPGWP